MSAKSVNGMCRPVLGFRCGDGSDPAENGTVRNKKPERLSAEDGCGRLCGTAGLAGAEGTGILLRRSSNNLNQLTRRVHETGRIYDADLEDIANGRCSYGRA